MEHYLSHFTGKRILVTGGLGFIGSNLVRHLREAEPSQLVVLDSLHKDMGGNRFNLEGLEGSVGIHVGDMGGLSKLGALVSGVDYIFNLAGQVSHVDSMQRPLEDVRSNYLIHLKLLEACRHHNRRVKIVYTSTRQVYGKPQFLPVHEGHDQNPVDVNGVNKLAAEKLHLVYHASFGIRSTVLRLTNTYGPRQLMKHDRQGFIACFIRKAVDGGEIQVFGDGSVLRELNYVDDVARALLMAGASEAVDGKIFNIGSSRSLPLKFLAETLIRLSGKGSYRLVDFPRDRIAIDIGSYLGDHSAFHRAVGWVPTVDLEEGLKGTLNYYAQYKAHYWSSHGTSRVRKHVPERSYPFLLPSHS